VLLLVLPPVIYISAINMSWREFKFNLRPILVLAVGCVVFTTIASLGVESDVPEEAMLTLGAQQEYFSSRVRMKCDIKEERREMVELHDKIELQLLTEERVLINAMLREGKLKDEARRRIERELDLREADVFNRRAERLR
jgi:hypothetical protein